MRNISVLFSKMIREVLVVILFVAAVAIASPVSESFERKGRIVGGSNAVLGRFPYQVSLRNIANEHFCGGSIINSRWILSAAHCTIWREQNSVLVWVGTVQLNSGGVSHTSSRIVNHPSYEGHSLSNDVSLVQTASVIAFTANVQAIALGSAQVGGGVSAVVTGWGATESSGGPSPNNLQQLTTMTITNADCRERYINSFAHNIFDHKICTLRPAGQGFCYGDSGGGLAAGSAVIATVSWMMPCARGFPDVYDRVSHFRTWIINTIAL